MGEGSKLPNQNIKTTIRAPTPIMANFLQKVFNQISLQRDERLWMSSDDRLLSDRLQLLAEFPETQFAPQLKLECVANAKNSKLSTALREKGIQLMY